MTHGAILLTVVIGVELAAGCRHGLAQTPEGLLRDGGRALEAGDFARAQQLFSALVKQSPSALNFNYLAMAEAGAGSLDQAIVHFRRSIELGNDSPEAHYRLGLAYIGRRLSKEGISELRLAVAKDPRLSSALYALSAALLDAGRPSEALSYLEQARERSPKDAKIWASLVRAQFEAGNAKEAIETADRAVEVLPDEAGLDVALADVCFQHHEVQKARHLLESASELLPKDPNLKLLLAKVSLEAREPVETLAVLKEAPSSIGAPGEVAFLRGSALALGGKLDEAATELSKATDSDPRNAKYLVAYAWVNQLQGRYKEALTPLSKARQLDRHAPIVLYRMALSHFVMGQYALAAETCDEALRLSPGFAPGYLLLGVVTLESGHVESAQAALQKGASQQPALPLLHTELGAALFMERRFKEGKRELDKALLLDPKGADAYFWRARVLARQGSTEHAISDLETAVVLRPGFAKAHHELAELYSMRGDPQKAAAALAKEKEARATKAGDERQRLFEILDDLFL